MDVITHQLVSETEIFGVVDVYFDIELLRMRQHIQTDIKNEFKFVRFVIIQSE